MTALALTLDPANAAIVITLTGAPDGAVTFTRTDTNGTNPVRLRTGQVPIAGAMVVQDYEVAMSGPVSYLVAGVGYTGGTATATTPGLGLAGARPRLASVQVPSIAAVPEMVTGYDAAATSATVVHWPVDRGDPVVVSRPARTREGTLTLFAASSADAHTLAGVAAPGRQLMLRQGDHPGMDMYLVVTDRRTSPQQALSGGRWVWTLEVRFVEVRSPAGPLLGAAGWTFDDVTAGYATFSAVRAAFHDFAALTVGPT